MKKLLSILLAVAMTVLCVGVVMANTIPVPVTKGASVSLEATNLDIDTYAITGNFGVSDALLLKAGIAPEGDAPQTLALGMRYELAQNMALTLDYSNTEDTNATTVLGFRAKHSINNAMALVGKIEYVDVNNESLEDTSSVDLTGQVEYAFNKLAVGNLGLKYSEPDLGDSAVTYLAGLKLIPTKNLNLWVDYNYPTHNVDSYLGTGVEIVF